MQSTNHDKRREATFADSHNAAVLGQVKQILLSSFASNVPKNRAGGVLAIHPGQRDKNSRDTPYVP